MPRLPGPRCKHVRVNGTRCECPALREEAYCYFHYRARQRQTSAAAVLPAAASSPAASPAAASPAAALPATAATSRAEEVTALAPPPDLFLLEDANAVQCALEWVLRRILDGSLEHRRAALLLHGLEIASVNVKLTNFAPLSDNLIKAAPTKSDSWQ